MGIINWWLGDNIAKPIESLAKPIDSISNLYTTDKARIEAEKDFQEVVQKPQIAATQLNKIFALSKNFFNSAYIPMLGWTCGFLILIFYAPQIVICTYVWGARAISTGIVAPFPMKADDLLYLIGLLYGVGLHSLAKR